MDQAEWGASDNNRRAKYYELTRSGRSQLQLEADAWQTLTTAVGLVLDMGAENGTDTGKRSTIDAEVSCAHWLSDSLSDVRYRLRAVFRRERVERELDEELEFHIEREARKLEATGSRLTRRCARHASPSAASSASRTTRATCAASPGSRRSPGPSLRRRAGCAPGPAFTAAVVLTLGLGIGANVAMFGIVDQLLFRTPPYLRDADRVHRVYFTYVDDGDADVTERDDRVHALPRLQALLPRRSTPRPCVAQRNFAIGVGEDAREMPVGIVSASFWGFFDATPVVGRFFTAREDSIPTGSPVAVLSYAFWQAQYGGSPNVLGQTRADRARCHARSSASRRRASSASPDEGAAGRVHSGDAVRRTACRRSAAASTTTTTYNWGWLSVLVRRKPGVSVDATHRRPDERVPPELGGASARSAATRRRVEVARPRATAGAGRARART